MRPALLDSLFAPAGALPGVGPKYAKLFDKLLDRPQGARVVDVLFHVPHAALDRRSRPKIGDAQRDSIVTLEVRVAEHRPPASPRSKAPFKVLVEDDTGDVELVFFLANIEWIKKRLPVGATRWVSGKLEMWDGHLQMVHPDRVMDAEEFARTPLVEPVYGLTEGLYPRIVQKAAQAGLARLPRLPEWIDEATLARLRAPAFAEALARMHNPQSPADVEPTSPWANRLAYDELLANQLALLLVRARMRELPGRAQPSEGKLAQKLIGALPYQLTGAQARSIQEIRADLASPQRMIRLLQGDVGSGKTVVALISMAHVVEAGRQAALMAPTEILARQHFERMRPLGEAVGLRLALFTGRDTAATRRTAQAALAAGEIDIAVGTHALFQESVEFRDLGLAVVDEQHRFGVHQRLALAGKGETADLLVMTATPIPRTLVLTYFGDMDVSALDEKPPGRTPIDTRTLPIERLDEVVAAVGRAIAGGARAYWVCPLVEESEALDVAAAEERAADPARLLRGRRRPRARAHEGRAEGRGDGALPARRDKGAGRHDGDRGRRRRAGSDDHGDRARRTFRPCAIAPVAGPGRARRRPLDLPAALQGPARRSLARAAAHPARDGRRIPHRRRGSAPARRGRRAGRPSGGRAGLPPRPARISRRAAAPGAPAGRSLARAQSPPRRRGKPGLADVALRLRTRRRGPPDGSGLTPPAGAPRGLEAASALAKSVDNPIPAPH